MADELAAFFSKKEKKSKKKKVVNLEEIGQQLERKARIQELNEYDAVDGEESQFIQLNNYKSTSQQQSNHQPAQNDEDSEWIDYNSVRPANAAEFTFKEYQEMAEETTTENTRRTPEVVKTWNIESVTNTEERAAQPVQPAAPAKPAAYQPPGQARRTVANVPLDVSSQEMFPSIATAEELEKKEKEKLKEVEEKKKASTSTPQAPAPAASEATPEVVREKPKKAQKIDLTQELFAVKEEPLIPAYRSRYDSPRGGGMDGSRPASGMGRRGPPNGGEPGESMAETDGAWRSGRVPPPKPTPQPVMQPREPFATSTPRQAYVPPQAQESSAASTPAATTNNWRQQARAPPTASPQHQPTDTSAQRESTTPTPGRYIPPSMRKRLEGL